jgi:hypothetical protein
MPQTQAWVAKAYTLLHQHIMLYTQDGRVSPDWVVGIISVECGMLNPSASRFEPAVFKEVQKVATGGSSKAYPGFNSGVLKQFIASQPGDWALRSLATSYGFGQIMGYHYLNNWGLRPNHYTALSVNDSVKFTVAFMVMGLRKLTFPHLIANGRSYLPYEQLLRWWNSGSTTGQTHDPNYVANATATAALYQRYASGGR